MQKNVDPLASFKRCFSVPSMTVVLSVSALLFNVLLSTSTTKSLLKQCSKPSAVEHHQEEAASQDLRRCQRGLRRNDEAGKSGPAGCDRHRERSHQPSHFRISEDGQKAQQQVLGGDS